MKVRATLSYGDSKILDETVSWDEPTYEKIDLNQRYAFVKDGDTAEVVVTQNSNGTRIELEFDTDVLAVVEFTFNKLSTNTRTWWSKLYLFNSVDRPVNCPSSVKDSTGCPSAFAIIPVLRNHGGTVMRVVRINRAVVWTALPDIAYFRIAVKVLGAYDGFSLAPLSDAWRELDYPTRHYFSAPEEVSVLGHTLGFGDEYVYNNGSVGTWNTFQQFYAYYGVNGLAVLSIASKSNWNYSVEFTDRPHRIVDQLQPFHYTSADVNYAYITYNVRRSGILYPVARVALPNTASHNLFIEETADLVQTVIGANVNNCWAGDTANLFVIG